MVDFNRRLYILQLLASWFTLLKFECIQYYTQFYVDPGTEDGPRAPGRPPMGPAPAPRAAPAIRERAE